MYLVFSSEKTLLNITTVAIEKKSLKRFYSHLWLLKGYFYCTLRKYDYLANFLQIFWGRQVNSIVPNAPFLYPLKTSENL